MTREETILCLKGIKNYGRDTFTEQSDWQESLDMAIKALEQESKSEWKQDHDILKAYSDGANEVLDKIRAEIDRQYKWLINTRCTICDVDIAFNRIFQFIDKYKEESEET